MDKNKDLELEETDDNETDSISVEDNTSEEGMLYNLEEDDLKDSSSSIVKEPGELEDNDEEKDNKNNKYSFIKELIIDVIIIIALVTIIPRYVIQRTIVSGTSMEETLHNGDNLLVEKVSYRFGNPKRFDVVVFYPHGKESGEYYIKRVIGLPGETIQMIDDTIYIDGEILEEDYGKDPIHYQGIAAEPLTLGDNEYFMVGDNREDSFDSRYEEIGPIDRKLIAGRAMIRIWPLNVFGDFDK